MSHRELYRHLVPEDAYIISFSDLLSCVSESAAKKTAQAIYYKIGGSLSTEAMEVGTKAHAIKENQLSDEWTNELRLAYKMDERYYLTGTIDRYWHTAGIVEDFKTTKKAPEWYLQTKQVETYSFLAITNGLFVKAGRYTTMNEDAEDIESVSVDISDATAVMCYSTFVLPRFNMIKNKIEEMRNRQYV